MPWKDEKDPYKIWLSEIILQQTKVEQGLHYYNRFVKTFPNIEKLAGAPREKIFKLWEGLGYYTRCKNLIATAKFIVKEKQGKFPDTYDELLRLKGIGPYTAAAIASFAFNLPHAVVDGNVFRALSRFFGIETPIDSTPGKKLFTELATALLHKKKPGIYNQAIMDFGAVICKPKNPLCGECLLKNKCVARLQNKIAAFPVKAAMPKKRSRWLYYFIVEWQGKIYVRKRGAKDIWENLYEFILLETEKLLTVEQIKTTSFFNAITGKDNPGMAQVSALYIQQLTHQTIHGRFFHLRVKNSPSLKDYKTVTYKGLGKLPFPKLISGYLAENELQAFER